jgi:hypothetical protein
MNDFWLAGRWLKPSKYANGVMSKSGCHYYGLKHRQKLFYFKRFIIFVGRGSFASGEMQNQLINFFELQ